MADLNQHFKITVPITRCYLRKTADGVEKYLVEGMASNTHLDLTGERMAESAIKSMAQSLQSHPVLFKSEHHDDWDAEFGEVTALSATDDHQLMMEAELDPNHYRTQTLVKALDKGKALGLSIGGLVPQGGAVVEWVSDLGRKVKTYKDILLEEISVTGSPAVSDTWLTNIAKSVKWSDDTTMTTTKDQAIEPTPAEPTLEVAKPAEPIVEEVAKPQDAPTETQPVTTDAPEPKDDAAITTKSAPAPAQGDTSEVKKFEIFGDYTEGSIVAGTVSNLSWTLQDYLWMTMASEDLTPEQQIAAIDAALTEFHELIVTVSTALIQADAGEGAEDVQAMALSFKETSPDAVAKSMTAKEAQVEELTKSVSDKSEELDAVQKALTEAQAESTASKDELTTIKARKAIVFDATEGALGMLDDLSDVTEVAQKAAMDAALKSAKQIAEQKEIDKQNRALAGFMTGSRI